MALTASRISASIYFIFCCSHFQLPPQNPQINELPSFEFAHALLPHDKAPPKLKKELFLWLKKPSLPKHRELCKAEFFMNKMEHKQQLATLNSLRILLTLTVSPVSNWVATKISALRYQPNQSKILESLQTLSRHTF